MEEERAKDRSVSPPEAPELPTDRAFVVQLSRESGHRPEPFSGRVEHLATGRRIRFDSLGDFQAAVIRLLTEAKRASEVGLP